MANNHNKESIEVELRRIQNSVPECYTKNLLSQKPINPDITKVLEEGIKGDFPEEKKAVWREMLADPTYNQMEIVEDKEIADKINKWIDKEIKKAVKAGRLPTKAQLKKLNLNLWSPEKKS